MPNGFLDVTVKTSPNFSAFEIGVQSGMRPLVLGCASSLVPMCQVIYRVSCAGLLPVGATQHFRPQPDLNRHTKALAIELQGHIKARQLRVLHFLLAKSEAHFN